MTSYTVFILIVLHVVEVKWEENVICKQLMGGFSIFRIRKEKEYKNKRDTCFCFSGYMVDVWLSISRWLPHINIEQPSFFAAEGRGGMAAENKRQNTIFRMNIFTWIICILYFYLFIFFSPLILPFRLHLNFPTIFRCFSVSSAYSFSPPSLSFYLRNAIE